MAVGERGGAARVNAARTRVAAKIERELAPRRVGDADDDVAKHGGDLSSTLLSRGPALTEMKMMWVNETNNCAAGLCDKP